jgi:nucleotide-binding universal stress UspA family protein
MNLQSTTPGDAVAAMRRELEATIPPYRTIVVGTDGSATAQEAVRHAVAISRAVGAELHLVSAARGKPSSVLGQEAEEAPADIRHTINPREDVAALLDAIAADVRSHGLDVVCHPEIDVNPAEAILRVARRTCADLIVVGNRGMTGVARLMGSVPNTVSHHASCSVAIIRTT